MGEGEEGKQALMSRSFHSTRAHIRNELGSDYADLENRATKLKKLYEENDKKRRTKKQVHNERKGSSAPIAPVSPDAIPI